MIRYTTGDEVRVGDIVRVGVGEDEQQVVQVFRSGTPEAEGFFCESSGGALLEPSRMLLTPKDLVWEDLELVRRATP